MFGRIFLASTRTRSTRPFLGGARAVTTNVPAKSTGRGQAKSNAGDRGGRGRWVRAVLHRLLEVLQQEALQSVPAVSRRLSASRW